MLQKTHLQSEKNNKLEVLLGTGVTVKSLGICRHVQFGIHDLQFLADFIALELGNADIILGIQWLRTLRKCQIDWDSHELSFTHHGK